MRRAAFDRAARCDQSLPDHLAAEYALPAILWATAAEEVHFEPLEIEDLEHLLNGGG